MDKQGRSSLSKFFRLTLLLLSIGIANSLVAQKYSFKPGERLIYKMNYGWFTVGDAVMWLDPEFHYPTDEPHYSVQAHIQTASWFKAFSKLEICMESLIQANNMQPLRSDRDMEGRNRIDIRHDYFKYGKDSIKVEAYVEDVDQWRYHRFEKGSVPVRDALSTFMWLRSKNRNELLKPIEVRTFFTNDLYEFTLRPKGKTYYKYNGERVAALEFELVFPEGEFFKNGRTGKAIVSDDERRLPLKFEIDMSVGSFKLQLEGVEYE